MCASPARDAAARLRDPCMPDEGYALVHGVWHVSPIAADLPRLMRCVCAQSHILAADPPSKSVYNRMADHELVIDGNFPDLQGFAQFEPSIKVLRGGAALDDDRDTIVVSCILRRHVWRKNGYLRLEVRASRTAPRFISPRQLRARRARVALLSPRPS